MSETDEAAAPAPPGLSRDEIELRRYEARLGVWKVVLGTFIVGLAGVLIPGAINFTTVLFDSWRKDAEFRLAQQTAHQQYIKDFFETAVNQDIELRIRFANYFANLSGTDQKALWTAYLADLEAQRNENRERINELEDRLVGLKRLPQEELDVAELDRTVRELNWAYGEIGYAPLDRSVVTGTVTNQERLYEEAVAVTGRLASVTGPLDPGSVDYLRFWELYKKDLIGVESVDFARRMIAIGAVLDPLARAGQPPSDELKRLIAELAELARQEIELARRPNRMPEQRLPPAAAR